MRSRTKVHKVGDLKALQEDLGTEVTFGVIHTLEFQILPVEYGGTNGTLAELRDYWKVQCLFAFSY